MKLISTKHVIMGFFMSIDNQSLSMHFKKEIYNDFQIQTCICYVK